MFKKGLITLVCLTVMSALWSWAATTYSISTKINSLGSTATVVDGKTVYTPIIGGSIQVRDFAAHTTGIKYTNLTTSALVDVVVTPAAGYKVSALTKNGVSQAVAVNQTAPVTVQVQKPSPISTQFVVATFAVAGDTAVVSKTWQLQLMNNNGGGKINYTRATVSTDYTAVGKLLAKNYIDTTPVTVTVTPNAGYVVDYLVVNGVKTFYGTNAVQTVNVDPSVGRIKSIVAGYKKQAITVTTANIANGGGIAPLNPVADPYGTVRLVISPTGSSNMVKTVTTTGGTLTLTDRFGDPVTLPYVGAVKATITGITSAITVSASYGVDVAQSGQYSGCTQTCHLQSSVPQSVRDANTTWLTSKHRTQNVDCVACHQVMPGPDYSTTAAQQALCSSCHTVAAPNVQHTAAGCTSCHGDLHAPSVRPDCASCHGVKTAEQLEVNPYNSEIGTRFASSKHAASSARAGSCSACHSHEGYVARAGAGKYTGGAELFANYTSTYRSITTLPVGSATIVGVSKKQCATCHTHDSQLRGMGAEVATGLLPSNGSTLAVDTTRTVYSAEFNLCVDCHQVKLDATFDAAAGYTGRGMYKYTLASEYSAANLIDATTGTYNFGKIFYHDGGSGTGRTFVDTHFGGTIAQHLVKFDGSAVDTTVAGYNINPGSKNACSICHDPHTAGKMLDVAAGTTVAVDDNNNAAISFATGLGNFHTNYLADPYSRVATGCTPCHTGSAFPRLTNGATIAELGSPEWSVAGCRSCHNLAQANATPGSNNAAAFEATRQFPAGYQFKFNATAATAVTAAELGNSTTCFECHKGRTAGIDVAALAENAAGTQNYTISYLHYAPSAAILFGDDSKMVATYAGKSYSGRFQHYNGTKFNCTDCHNVHTGKDVMETSASCNSCHAAGSVVSKTNLKARTRAYSERLLDTVLAAVLAADGQAGLNATLQAKITELKGQDLATQKETLMSYIEERQVYFPSKAIAHAAVTWKVFTYEDGPVDGQAHGHGGSWAHNSRFARQMMYDAIESLGGSLTGLTRPAVLAAAAGPHDAAAAVAAASINTTGSLAQTAIANSVTAACSSCHATENFESSRHANQSARGGNCSACHSHEGFVARAATKVTNYEELAAVYNATTQPELFALPVAGTTFNGVTKKNCATCHDNTQNNKLRGAGDETVVEGLIDGTASTAVRTKYSAQFNLCTACHTVQLDATWDTTEGYGEMGMFKYSLSANYAAENLIDGTTGTYNFNKVFYHDGGSGSGRTFVDTHFGGTIASHLVNFDGSTGNVTLKGYNINPGNPDACTICHDPHTAGKMLSVAAGQLDDNNNATVSYATGLGDFHTDYLSDRFSRGSVTAQSSSCMPCHNGSNFAEKTEGKTSTDTFWRVIGCNSCHNLDKPNTVAATNDAAAFDDVRQFPAGYEFKFNSAAAAVPVADLGASQVCFECHKGRIAGADVQAMTDPAAGTRNYAISYLHYAPSMAILYGDDSKMVATYAGKSYSGRFQHPMAVNGKTNFSCTDCHNVHTGGNFLTSGSCVGCHDGATAPTAATLKADVRAFSERLLDTVLTAVLAADNQVGMNTVLQAKIDELQTQDLATQRETLMTYIEERDVYFPNKAIAQAAVAWKVFTYEDGAEDGQAHGHGGSWAHNGKFAKQVMFDAIESLGGNVADLTRPSL